MSDILGTLLGSVDADDRFYGVSPGIVTNTDDPDGLGRVRVRLLWMADGVETQWARIAAPMAGQNRGVYFPPEVQDEVLVAFEHGNPQFPYVLGGLWNGADGPPDPNTEGKNDVRVIRSRSGHVVRLVDATDGERIEIVDKSGDNSIVIDAAGNSVTVTSAGKLVLRGDGGVEISSDGEIRIESRSGAKVKAGAQLDLAGRIVNIN